MTIAEGARGGEGIIRVMPEPLANKIAAGEVVQRPASALKELVENSLDAGARHVTILLRGAGSELLQVVDDGSGMSHADAEASFRRHATSKIRHIEDLESLQTLGFRGEALASIAAVSQVELRTQRLGDTAGTRVRFEGGHLVGTEPVATTPGTSVAVRNLFYNVPARRSFLKSPATEYKHLLETFQFLALSNPTVGFTLLHNDEEVYRLDGQAGRDPFEALRARIGDLFGADYAEKLVTVEEATSYLTVRGFVGQPGFFRRSRGEQYLFVNGRYVRNRSLDHAVYAGYDVLLPQGTYPFYALFLTLDPGHVDVNVHPTKAEVKFDDERGIHGFVRAVVRKALGAATMTPQMSLATVAAAEARFTPAAMPTGEAAEREDEAASSGTSAAPEAAAAWPPVVENVPTRHTVASGALDLDADEERADVLVQLHGGYILTSLRSGLMILDQQAAHERILFERAMSTMQNGMALTQQLLFPRTVEFSAPDLALIRELLPELRALGFDLEHFGGRTLVIRGVPADIPSGDERTILDDLLAQYRAQADALRVPSRELLARSMARRGAISPARRLSDKEMHGLIDQLFQCTMPLVSPDGRPTLVKITSEELRRRFGRA